MKATTLPAGQRAAVRQGGFGTDGDLSADWARLTRAATSIPGLIVGARLHHTDKSIVAAGVLGGTEVVLKLVTSHDEVWQDRRGHELAVLTALTVNPPKQVTVPELVLFATDPLTVTSSVAGHRLGNHRYTDTDLTTTNTSAVLDALDHFAAWPAPPPVRRAWFNYHARLDAIHADRRIGADDHAIALRLLDTVTSRVLQHGDPLPANILLHRGEAGLIDFEHTGLYTPGWDYALLDVLAGSNSPTLRTAITTRITDHGLAAGYAVNLMIVIAREITMHTQIPASPVRAARLALLDREQRRARHILHTTGAC